MSEYAEPFVDEQVIPVTSGAIRHFEIARGLDKAASAALIRKHNLWVRVLTAESLNDLKRAIIISVPWMNMTE